MSVMMPTMAVAVAVVVEMLDRDQPRPAAIIGLGPRSVDLAGRVIIALRPGSVELTRRIGVVRTRCFGTGRETGQQDYRREESKRAHTLDVVSLRRDGKIAGRKQAALQGNVIV
jgi:hypothetical protein